MNKKETKKHGFRSLRTQLTVLFFALTAGTILMIFLANTFFLEQYYLSEKQNALESAYQSLYEAAQEGTITSSEFDVELLRICSRDNIGVVVMSAESRTVKSYASDTQTMMRRMWDNLFDATEKLPEDTEENTNESELTDQYYIVRTLQTSDRASGQRAQIVFDLKTHTQYMELWGNLDGGYYYLMRTAIESIRNDTRIANRFVLYIGMAATILTFLLSIYLGRRITRPIRALSDISRRMRDLDFSARYEGDDKNEIGTLGESINDLSKTLEQTISELKTANHELQSDLEQKEKTEAMQREFISNVTHELKTPIALIQGYAEGLKDGITDDEESREFYTEVIMDEAGKMNRMVQQLLSLMHLEFGESQVSVERFDVAEMIHGELQSVGLMAQDAGIEVHMEQKDPVFVWSDQFMVEEVFQNYFTNAVHHCAGAQKVIDIRFAQKENCVRISVFNTGTPIPEESIPRIWDKFYKVDKARTREYGGSGVGLSIVKAIMDQLHQQYGVINYDNGVEFWFELETKI